MAQDATRPGIVGLVGVLGGVWLGLLACRTEPETPPGAVDHPDPWLELEDQPLDDFRLLRSTPLGDAVAPTHLVHLPDVPLTWAVDPDAGVAWGLDARYQHEPATQCADTSLWPELDDQGGRRGDCPTGTVEIDRGSMDGGSPVLAAATDAFLPGIWILGEDGSLAFASSDPLEGNPLDYLRPQSLVTLDLDGDPVLLESDGSGGLWLADGNLLQHRDGTGTVDAQLELDSAPVALASDDDVVWVLDAQGLSVWDGTEQTALQELDGTGGRLLTVDEGVWASLPAEGRLVHSDGSVIDLADLTGPLGADDTGLWVAVDGGLARVEHGVEVERQPVEGLVDLVVQTTGEVVVLDVEHSVSVYVDETRLPDAAPVNLSLLTFMENPKPNEDTEPGCPNPGAMDNVLDQGIDNARMLYDVPAEVVLGIIPEVTERIAACDLEERLERVWSQDRISSGLFLYGEQEDDQVDADAVRAFLDEQATAHRSSGAPLEWIGGGERLGDGGEDWVALLGEADLAEDVLGFGLAVLPEVDNWDPRTKEPYPWSASEPLTAWRPTSALDVTTHDPDGPLLLRPGSTISVFTLGECANTWLFECKQSHNGGNTTIDDQDLEILSLMLWRALAVRSADGPDHWYFHLPAIGLYDYTDGCTRNARVWEGEDCQAERMQQWFFDVQARYIASGHAVWWTPEG